VITPRMAEHLLKPYRRMAWLVYVERPGADLYFWSGNYHMTYAGNLYYGYGYLTRMESIQKDTAVDHIEQVFEFSGLKTSILGEINSSVRGLKASIQLAGIDEGRAIVPDPIPYAMNLIQDTLGWSDKAEDGTITLRLTCFNALPFLGRALGEKWSYEGQQEAFPGDTGFKYNRPIAMQGPAVPWTL
jgi:hypothetical protein